jgi:hypothetical protein
MQANAFPMDKYPIQPSSVSKFLEFSFPPSNTGNTLGILVHPVLYALFQKERTFPS